MPIRETLNAKPITLAEVLSNGRRYAIPPFQRDYAWEEREWSDLWDDIEELDRRRGEAVEHYLGALVLQAAPGGGDRRIIDGQQRLVTLSLLALAVIARIERLAEEGQESDDNRERVRLLRERFVSTRHPASLQYHPRLSLNDHDNPFYRSYLVQGQRPARPRSLRGSEKRLYDAFRYFEERVAERFPDASGATLAAFLDGTVAARLRFIEIVVEDDETAFTVFETLNARGVALGTADLLKNFLFQVAAAGGASDLDAARDLWAQIVGLVPMDRLATMFFHRLAGQVVGLKEKRVFSAVKAMVPARQDAFGFLREMKETAEVYAALDDPLSTFWLDYPGARVEVQRLSILRMVQPRPLILAALPRFEERPEKLANLLRRIVAVSVRAWVSRVNTGDVQRAYQDAALRTERRELKSPRAMAAALRSIHVGDERFRADFAQLQLNPKGPRKKLVRYLLSELEVAFGGLPIDFESSDATIEHVLPENRGDGFPAFSAMAHRDDVIRLGNLTPLEYALNRRIGAAAFLRKREAYAESKFALTKAIVATEWTPEAVRARQQQMAEAAVRIWSLDGADEGE